MEGYLYLFTIYLTNNTGQLVTLNQLTAPLNVYLSNDNDNGAPMSFQPYAAAAITPQSGQGQLLVAVQGVDAPASNATAAFLDVAYNLAGGAILTINYNWQANTTPQITLAGANTSKYVFSSTSAVQTYLQGPQYFLTTLTITVGLAS
jgi:hypothetical protein